MQPQDVRNLIHSPAELSTSFVAWAKHNIIDPGIPFGVPAIDKRVIPMRPGDLIGFVARPGNGKSSVMALLARQHARRLREQGRKDEVVVYCTWESSAEELENMFQADAEYSASDIAWGRADLETIKRKAVGRASLPIWVFGHGISRAGQKTARMTPEIVLEAIESMREDYGVRPALMLFDYLQLIPVDAAKDRVSQVTEAPIRIKEVALRTGAPAIIGVQAGRAVDQRRAKIPEMADCQWGSSIEQAVDKLFALWRPIITEEPGELIDIGSHTYKIDEHLLVLRMLKQRGDRGRYTWAMYFDPANMKLAEMKTEIGPAKEGFAW